jgi:hypothetical protein
MNVSPILTWDDAEAYFMFADNPGAIMLILALSVAITVGTVITSIKHEMDTYIDYQ